MAQGKIKRIAGREILDSRGNPTLEAVVVTQEGWVGRASVPSGASTGAGEALELRDRDESRYGGKGVLKAAAKISGIISRALRDIPVGNQGQVDRLLLEADGTEDRSGLGANAILAVSLAAARCAAAGRGLPLFQAAGGFGANLLPVPMLNVLGGGAHASNNLDVQEFMIMPVGAPSFREGLRWSAEVYRSLGALLRERGFSASVGDEGGYAPNLEGEAQALELLLEAVRRAGYEPYRDFVLAMDAAASEWAREDGSYFLPKAGQARTREELIRHWIKLTEDYPVYSLEDPLGEEDWEGWRRITAELGSRVQLVGDDLFVTNRERLISGIRQGCGNSLLVKPNQIGTLTEALEAVRTAHQSGYTAVASHRSGETEDTSIADLAVAWGCGQIKAGAPCRGERIAKYNQLLRIEQWLGENARYPGMEIFSHLSRT